LLNPSKKISTYSKGNRQKVALIAALASPVELYLFDEPTSGLDPLMEGEFRECVNELRGQGATVLLSSHILAEVEALADRVTIIRDGTTVETGSLAEMRHLARTSIDVETEHRPTSLEGRDGIHALTITGHRAQFQVDRDNLGSTINELAALNIKALVSSPPTLEELFVRHYHHVPHASSEAES
jgi:ABC-2 type transport system ATP-binding protein